jgi:methyltransferase family protein
MTRSAPFDARYFRRFYESRRSRVYGKEQINHLAHGVVGLVRWFGGDVEHVLDVGAGIGLWGHWFRTHLPKAHYRSIDVSAYACQTYGHEHRDISSWRGRQKFDLVICQGVLPYLEDRACAKAVSNMAAMCRGFLYLEAITARDLRDVCDRGRTDVDVHARPAAFYRHALARSFEPLGCGLHHVKGGDLLFYELEKGR